MNRNETILCEEIVKDHPYVTALRRYLHAHPELSAKEFHTQEKIEEELHRLGLAARRIAGTGVYTEISGEKEKGTGKTIVLRADIDALPIQEVRDVPYRSRNEGVMHACGHDAHTAALIGAIRVLVKHRDLFPGKIVITFQPGEEIGYGARLIVKEGDLSGADRTFGIHMASYVPVGTIAIKPGPNNASVDMFRILVHGRSGHIAKPHQCADAGFAACQIAVQSQSILTRRIDPAESVLLGIGHIEAGRSYNVIPGEAIIEGTLRTFNEKVRQQVLREFEALIRNTAEQYGCTAEFHNQDNTSPLVNDPEAAREAQKVAASIFGEDHVWKDLPLSMVGDDMAEYIRAVPGVYCYVGSGNAARPETCVPHHDDRFDIDEDALRVAASIYACYAVDYLNGDCG